MNQHLRFIYSGVFFLVFLLIFSILSSAYAEVSFIWPSQGQIITEFTDTGYEKGGHRGIDIEAEEGTAVYAAADGVVHWKGKTPFGEPYVSIQHADGKRTTYMPVPSNLEKGRVIKQGDIIGAVLAGGSSSPITHLHFGVKVAPYGSNDYSDPLVLLPPLATEPGKPNTSSAFSASTSKSTNSESVPNSAQVPTSSSSTASVQTAASPLAQSNPETLGSTEVVSNRQEGARTKSTPQIKDLSETAANTSNAKVGECLSEQSTQKNEVKTKENLEQLLAPSLPARVESPLKSKSARQDSIQFNSANGYPSAEDNTNPGQIALLLIAFFLTLLFIFKKRIASYLKPRLLLMPSFLRSTY